MTKESMRVRFAERMDMKTPIYKKWWFWMLITLTVLANMMSVGYGLYDAAGLVCLPY